MVQFQTAKNALKGIHLAHSRASFGSLISDDNTISGSDLIGQQCLFGFIFTAKNLGRTAMLQHFLGHCSLFNHGSTRRQVPLEDGYGSLGEYRIF